MAKLTPLSSVQVMNGIDLTPLMDLTFLLLINFIITFPLIEQGVPVDLPSGEAAEVDSSQTRTITLNVEGDLFLDEAPVSREALAAEMMELGRSNPDITVCVRADKGILYGKVADIMALLHQARITRMALITSAEPQAP